MGDSNHREDGARQRESGAEGAEGDFRRRRREQAQRDVALWEEWHRMRQDHG